MLSPRELRIIRECLVAFLEEMEMSQHFRREQLLNSSSAASIRLETLLHNTVLAVRAWIVFYVLVRSQWGG